MDLELSLRIVSGSVYRAPNLTMDSSSNSAYLQRAKAHQEKTAHNVAMCLKDMAQKFTGHICQFQKNHQDQCKQVAEDRDLSNDRRFHFLHKILCNDAHGLYLQVVNPVTMSYKKAVKMVTVEYNYVVKNLYYKLPQ